MKIPTPISINTAQTNIKTDDQLIIPYHQTSYLIDGRIDQWNGPVEPVESPIEFINDGQKSRKIGSYPRMDKNASLKALDSAVKSYDFGRGLWPTLSVEKRIEHVQTFIKLMQAKRGDLVKLLMWEIGKSRKDSEKEFDRTIEYIIDTIDELKNLDRAASRFTIKNGIIAQIRRSSLGVVLCMGPFNYPLNETFTTLIPALIMGNTVIFKPPKLGVLLHAPLLEAFQKAFPAGVINTVYGDGQEVISPLMESGKIDVLAFIGSSRVADILKKQHPHPHKLRSVLGLDAKNPAIVLPDADIHVAVSECITGALSFNGQRCTAIKMIFVHQTIYRQFLERLSDAVEKLKMGLPWDDGVQITPLPESNKTEYLHNLVQDALDKGARIANTSGGQYNNTFFSPTILAEVNAKMRIYHEEQFGPIVPVLPYHDLSEPLQYIIESKYGQQASIFGQNADDISKLVDTLVNQVSRVNINSQCQRGPDVFPFTGRKDSAEGTLSVSDALRVFSIRSLVAFNATEANKHILNEVLKENKSNFLSTDFIF